MNFKTFGFLFSILSVIYSTGAFAMSENEAPNKSSVHPSSRQTLLPNDPLAEEGLMLRKQIEKSSDPLKDENLTKEGLKLLKILQNAKIKEAKSNQ